MKKLMLLGIILGAMSITGAQAYVDAVGFVKTDNGPVIHLWEFKKGVVHPKGVKIPKFLPYELPYVVHPAHKNVTTNVKMDSLVLRRESGKNFLFKPSKVNETLESILKDLDKPMTKEEIELMTYTGE